MKHLVDVAYKKIKQQYDYNIPRQLVNDAGVKLLEMPLDDKTGGMSVTNNRCSTIILNAEWDDHYLDFVMLHELAHLKLHKHESTPFYRRVGNDQFIPQNEHEANSLAMRLLLDLKDHDVICQLTKYQLMDYLGVDLYLAQYV